VSSDFNSDWFDAGKTHNGQLDILIGWAIVTVDRKKTPKIMGRNEKPR
jgi:hypothetical protein